MTADGARLPERTGFAIADDAPVYAISVAAQLAQVTSASPSSCIAPVTTTCAPRHSPAAVPAPRPRARATDPTSAPIAPTARPATGQAQAPLRVATMGRFGIGNRVRSPMAVRTSASRGRSLSFPVTAMPFPCWPLPGLIANQGAQGNP